MPWWKTTLFGVTGLLGALTVGSAVMYGLSVRKEGRASGDGASDPIAQDPTENN